MTFINWKENMDQKAMNDSCIVGKLCAIYFQLIENSPGLWKSKVSSQIGIYRSVTRATCYIMACNLSTSFLSIIEINEWKVQRTQRLATCRHFVAQPAENRATSDRMSHVWWTRKKYTGIGLHRDSSHHKPYAAQNALNINFLFRGIVIISYPIIPHCLIIRLLILYY